MRAMRHLGIPAAALPLLLCACNKTLPNRPKDTTKANRLVEDIDLSVRLRVAETRITKLEHRVFELQAAPGTVEADLLRQRLSITEAALADTARASAEMPVPMPAPPSPSPARKSTARTEPNPAATTLPSRSSSKSSTVTSRLRLVDPKTFEMTR